MISNSIDQIICVKRTSTSIMTHVIELLNIHSLQNLSFRREDKVLFSPVLIADACMTSSGYFTHVAPCLVVTVSVCGTLRIF